MSKVLTPEEKAYLDGTVDVLDISSKSKVCPENIPGFVEGMDGIYRTEDVYEPLMLFRNEEAALKWLEENYPDSVQRTKEDLHEEDGSRETYPECFNNYYGRSAEIYDGNGNQLNGLVLTELLTGGYVLWQGY